MESIRRIQVLGNTISFWRRIAYCQYFDCQGIGYRQYVSICRKMPFQSPKYGTVTSKCIWVLFFCSFRRVVRHKNRPPWVLARLALLLLISVKNPSHFVSAIFESPCSRLRRSTKKSVLRVFLAIARRIQYIPIYRTR